MVTALPKPKYTLQEYFELEKNSEEKLEFWDGNVWSMSVASPVHERIVVNVGGAFARPTAWPQLLGFWLKS